MLTVPHGIAVNSTEKTICWSARSRKTCILAVRARLPELMEPDAWLRSQRKCHKESLALSTGRDTVLSVNVKLLFWAE